jgi:hypothetical protein|tara:strand:+ start:1726 stop:1959 length:234 start_codon:yes stop_codon:yes gene_type:complete
MSFYTRFLPTFFAHGTDFDTAVCNELEQEIEKCGEQLGADYCYVSKNYTNGYRPLTFAFYAEGGKFLARRTTNTVIV